MNTKVQVNLQFLRAVAALAVVFYHAAAHYSAIGGSSTGNIFSFISQFGYAGVDVFFVISGYIMWITTRRTEGTKAVVSFLYNRLTRIYLGYWPYFILLLLIVFFYAPAELNRIDLGGSFFLTQYSLDKMLLKVSWTLRFELYFYLCFSLILLFSRKTALSILIFLMLFIIGFQLWAIFIFDAYSTANFPTTSSLITFYLSPYGLEFIAGCLIARFFETHRIKHLALWVFSALGLFVLTLYVQNNLGTGNFSQGYFLPQRVLFFGLLSAAFLMIMVELEERKFILWPRFSLNVGGASYSLYLSHTIILYLFYVTGLRDFIANIGAYQGGFMFLVVAVIVLYSIMHYRYIETPLMRGAKRFKFWLPMWLRLKTKGS